MTTNAEPLGRCPHCRTEIPKRQLLISYRTADEEAREFAECPNCRDVVAPG